MNNRRSFTLMELMISLIIISIVVGYGTVEYKKSLQKNHERHATLQLIALHDANEIYRARANEYWDGNGGTATTATIESKLGINLIDGDFGFFYTRDPGDPEKYEATAVKTGLAADSYTVVVHQGAVTSANPCCQVAGFACPSLNDC